MTASSVQAKMIAFSIKHCQEEGIGGEWDGHAPGAQTVLQERRDARFSKENPPPDLGSPT